MSVRLSVALIVRDAADDLTDCLASVEDIADEIVVLDTGSADGSVDIARAAGARVIEGAWHDDFARARNEVLEHCTGEWIFSLDADERIDMVNAHRLRRAVRLATASEEGILALAVTIESEIGMSGTGMNARHVFPRVFRNLPEIRWRNALHEQLVHASSEIMERTRLTDVVLLHLGYARGGSHGGRRDRNERILKDTGAQTAFDRLSTASSAINHGRHDEAIEILAELLDDALPPNLDATARWSLATSLLTTGRRGDARRELETAALRHPDHQSFRYLLGLVHLEEGRWIEARERFDDLIACDERGPSARTDVIPSRRTVRVQRARTFLAVGDPETALAEIDGVLALDPEHFEARFQRALCLEALGRRDDAREVLEDLQSVLDAEPAVEAALRRLRARTSEPSLASAAPDRVADGPSDDGLTVAIIARDEASNLAGLLPSIQSLADEIVVVDTGSTDDTLEVARGHGARIVTHAWDDDFAAARNAGLSAVTRRWVLWLDADERMPEHFWTEIRRVVAGGEFDAVSLRITSVHGADDPVASSTGRFCRLFRADLGARFEGRVHEQILPALERAGARVVESPITIEHHGYALSPEEMRRKKLRNLALLTRQAGDDPDDYYVRFQIGSTCVALGRHEEAIGHLEHARRTVPPSAPLEIRLWIELRLAQSAFVGRRIDEAETAVTRALALWPRLELGLYLRAALHAVRGEPSAAIECLRLILDAESPDPFAPVRHDGVEAELRRLQLGLIEHEGAA